MFVVPDASANIEIHAFAVVINWEGCITLSSQKLLPNGCISANTGLDGQKQVLLTVSLKSADILKMLAVLSV